MKQKDLALILVIAFISAVIAVFVSNAVFTGGNKRKQKAEVVESISSEFKAPDSTYFNPQSIDPTQPITIGNTTNPDPFTGQ